MSDPERAERLVIAFLAGALLIGIGITAYNKSKPGPEIRIGRFSAGEKGAISPAQAVRPGSSAVNINTADAAALANLKGIGEALAGRIVEYRSSNGSFISKEDIKKVKGVGPSLYEKIKDDISVE